MSNKHFIYPTSLKKKLKACSRCHLIKTEEQFNKEGCENCGYEKREALQYITSHFKGMIAIMDTKYSWAARWLNLKDYLPGFYCLDILNMENEEENSYENDDYKIEEEENEIKYDDEE